MTEAGIEPDDIVSLECLRALPLIDKALVRDFGAGLTVADRPRGDTVTKYSSGTTSPSFAFVTSASAWGFENAFFHRWYGWCGYRVGSRAAVVTGSFSPRPFDYNPVGNILNVNVGSCSADTYKLVLNALEDFCPAVLRGYPSLLYALAREILESGSRWRWPRRVEAVFLSSETVFEHQVETIREVFDVPIYSHYGQGEQVALTQQCPVGDLQHIIPEYSYVEVLKPDGEPAGPGEPGVIAGTSFANEAMVLLRYVTADVAVLAPGDRCPACGREYRSMLRIDGRSGDYIRAESGRSWAETVVEYATVGPRHIKESQIWQTDLHSIVLLVVPDQGYSEDDGACYVEVLRSLLDEPSFTYEVRVVSAIERPASMKQRFVRSDVPAPSLVSASGAPGKRPSGTASDREHETARRSSPGM
jgi:phenylacetate-coenzyme A ligase PaaK-like adenylate-forming protein